MKKTILFLILITSSLSYSQNNLNYGIKAGLSMIGFNQNFGNEPGINFGGIIEYKLNPRLDFQSELSYSKAGGYIQDKFIKLEYIQVPLILKLNLTSVISFSGGIQAGYLINDNISENFNLSGIAGVNFKITKKIFSQLRYDFGLNNIGSETKEIKNSGAGISIGYFFN